MYTEGVVQGRYSANINILVVDDDITTLNIVSAMLKTWSYEVVTVPNPIDALSILRKRKYSFDLVVTDLHMPQMNGLELQKLVHDEFELPVIMMSSDDKESVILKSLEGGSAYYIVKPVSKDDIKMVWQCILQSRKSRSSCVTLEELMEGASGEFASGQLLQGPDELEDLDCSSFNNDDVRYKGDHKKGQSTGKRKTRKRDRTMDKEEDDDDENDRRMLATKKAKVVWSNALHNHFLLAIRHIGLEKAVPKRILEFMNVPGLTRENVASHLQKYRMFLKRVAEKARLSKCLSERIFRSSMEFGLPATSSFNHVQREQYAEYLKQQMQMNEMGLAPPFQNTLAPPGTSHLGSSFQYPLNYNQQPAAQNLASTRSNPAQLLNSGQSCLLMNNTLQQQRPMQLGNGMNMLSQANHGSGFGMQMMNNNFGRIGGYDHGVMNNGGGNGLLDGGTYSQQSQAKQLQHGLNFTSNPFSFGTTPRISSPSIDNLMSPFDNADPGPNFAGRTSQPAGGIDNIVHGGYINGLAINNEVVTGLTKGVRNVNRNGTTFNAPTLGNIGNNASTSRFESSSANPFAPIIPRNIQQQQNGSASLLLSPHGLQLNPYRMPSTAAGGCSDYSYGAYMNNGRKNFNHISLANDDDDIMVVNNLVLQQLHSCQSPSHQKQGGEEVPANFTGRSYQDKDPAPTPKMDAQSNTNRAANVLVQLTPDHVANSPVQLNANPSLNGQVRQPNPNPFVSQYQQNHDPNVFNQVEVHPSPTSTVNSEVQLNSAVNDDEAQLDPIHYMNEVNSNPAGYHQLDLKPTGNQFGNPNVSSSPAANRQLGELYPTANQIGNPNICGVGSYVYHMEHDAPEDEQLWSLREQGGENQMLDSELTNMFHASDDYSTLFDQQFTAQDGDDDFLNALIGLGNY